MEKNVENSVSSPPFSSSTTNQEGKLFCYECQTFRPKDVMQEKECSNCKGLKCFNHGGSKLYTCEYCKLEGICADCSSFISCCHVVDRQTKEIKFVGREVVLLKREVKILKAENERLRESLSTILKVSSAFIQKVNNQ